MNETPIANRKHIALFGNTNAGKSALLNAMVGQEVSIVSNIHGTTTDPVSKVMELIPYGPVVFIDTAGLNDTSELGKERIRTSRKIFQRTDFAIYVIDASNPNHESYELMMQDFAKWNIPFITVVNKIDLVSEAIIEELRAKFRAAIFVSSQTGENVLELKDLLIERLRASEEVETYIGDLLPYGSTVIMVIPIDSEAPKGRIILTQVQLIRDCLDHGIKSYVVRDTELESALKDLGKVDLVVTDSQAFKFVNSVVPKEIKLTSFSILFARVKGDMDVFIEGLKKIDELVDGSKVLVSESCTHNHSHEDIGRIKIPRLLNQYTGKKIEYDFRMGHDFPDEIEGYDLIIHCGSCMLNKKVMTSRISLCKDNNVDITNYGVILAYLNGILERSVEIIYNK
ncbi:MAG: [FeFe] hydrogenase H-cluster maturation GTPase HydF [Bacillota bacterium]